MWLARSPAGAPPTKGLGSGDAIDWLISLDEASARMAAMGYDMAGITRAEAAEQREAKLSGSVGLLASKASNGHRVIRRRKRRNLALYLGAGTVIAALGYAATRLARGDDR